MIQIKRAYAPAEAADGGRVLVDRLWPRGMKRDEFKMDEWMKDLGPSHELRKWFGHRPERWEEFERRYRAELKAPARQALLRRLADAARVGPVTLLYGAKDEERNQAVVLARVLADDFGCEIAVPAGAAVGEDCACLEVSANR